MIEDIQEGGEEPGKPLMTPEAQKKFLYGAAVLILMGVSFFAGRFSVTNSAPKPDSLAQFKLPTPVPLGTPVAMTESSLTMINFLGVSEGKKASVLSDFNIKKCKCNCGMSEAECIVKDPNCPFWKEHVTDFQKALGNGKNADLSKAAKSQMSFPAVPKGMTGNMGAEMPSGLEIQPKAGK